MDIEEFCGKEKKLVKECKRKKKESAKRLEDFTKEGKIIDRFVTGVLGTFLAVGLYVGVAEYNNIRKFNDAYKTALFKYGDTNHDGIITNEEKSTFEMNFLKNNGVTLISPDRSVYKNGEKVPKSTITKWLKNYKSLK